MALVAQEMADKRVTHVRMNLHTPDVQQGRNYFHRNLFTISPPQDLYMFKQPWQ